MNPEVKQAEAEKTLVQVNVEQAGAITTVSATEEPASQWERIREQVLQILSELPEYVGGFFSDYQKPIITLVLLLSGVISVKVFLAVLDAINDIPLLEPTFELVGLGYTAWFVYRYLLRANTRKELSEELQAFKEQIIGQNSPKS
jgi:glutamyl-tRNA synthetase